MQHKKVDNEHPNSSIRVEMVERANPPRWPSLGFCLVAIGIVAYILYAAKFFTFAALFPVAIASVITGFVILIVETLGKIKIH